MPITDLFQVRFASALSDYKSTVAHGGKFIFLIHDLWGADGTQNSTALYPGDNDDWSSWDAYLTQFISDINANGATASLSIDIVSPATFKYHYSMLAD